MAKASLISNRSTSATCQPSLVSNPSMAPIGAMVNSLGSRAKLCTPKMRAVGVNPCCSTASLLANTNAEAPSEIELALAAVMVPSFLKAARNCGILSIRAWPGCSSTVTVVVPLRLTMSTAVISVSKSPLAIAALALDKDPMAKLSIASRLKP